MTISCQDERKSSEEDERPETERRVSTLPSCFPFFRLSPSVLSHIGLISRSLDAAECFFFVFFSGILAGPMVSQLTDFAKQDSNSEGLSPESRFSDSNQIKLLTWIKLNQV